MICSHYWSPWRRATSKVWSGRMIWQTEFSTMLKDEFDRRKSVDSSFSLNKFAKMAGVSPGTMSELFHSKRDWSLTEERAVEIVSRLPLARSTRNRLLVGMGVVEPLTFEELQTPLYDFLLNWKHQAVIMSLDLAPEHRTEEMLLQKFDLKLSELSEILFWGLENGLVTVDADGNYQRVPKAWGATDPVPNAVLRGHQKQNLGLVQAALDGIPPEKRDITSMVFVGNKAQVEIVRRELRALYERVHAIMNVESNDEVYQLAVSLIPLGRDVDGGHQ